MELSTEAKVVLGSFWGSMWGPNPVCEVSFERPHIITEQTRKGLDELVGAGYLTVEEFDNPHSDKLTWKPIPEMMPDRPKVSQAFIKKHSFKITTE